jgi:hypothetical protein
MTAAAFDFFDELALATQERGTGTSHRLVFLRCASYKSLAVIALAIFGAGFATFAAASACLWEQKLHAACKFTEKRVGPWHNADTAVCCRRSNFSKREFAGRKPGTRNAPLQHKHRQGQPGLQGNLYMPQLSPWLLNTSINISLCEPSGKITGLLLLSWRSLRLGFHITGRFRRRLRDLSLP